MKCEPVWAYGYRFGEVDLKEIPESKVGAQIRSLKFPIEDRRPVMGSLGCHVEGFAMPHPDLFDLPTLVHGVRCRFMAEMPKMDRNKLARFRCFVQKWVKGNLVPLSPDVDVSFETWIKIRNYPEWRKEELRQKYSKCENFRDPKHWKCKSFPKDECYPSYKPERGINSRSDEFKCHVGPWFAAIEEEVYKHESFIKHVPVRDRPKYIMEMLYGHDVEYIATDYSTFEAMFIKELMEACEFELYDYMLSRVPGSREVLEDLRAAMLGENVCEYKLMTVLLEATRMSGEMCTSLGNGFTNLMLMLFLCSERGCTDVRGVVEGDDGLFTVNGTRPTVEDFASMGAVIKLETHRQISTASFCGIVFDEQEKINLTDVCEVIAQFGWTSMRYAKARPKLKKQMLRCKALSYAHQYPGCPVISAIARYGLRVSSSEKYHLRGFVAKQGGASMSMWERDQILAALADEPTILDVPVGPRTRLLVESLYGIPVAHQVAMEKYLDSLEVLTPLRMPYFDLHAPSVWSDYASKYVVRHCEPVQGVRIRSDMSSLVSSLQGLEILRDLLVLLPGSVDPARTRV